MSVGLSLILIPLLASCGSSTLVPPDSGADAPAQSSSAETEGAATVTVDLHLDESIDFEELLIKWVDLEDSRCPIGLTCIWAGQILVRLEVTRGESESLEVELLRPVGGDPEEARQFGYVFRLLEVQPHPEDGATPERSDRIATIEIRQP